MKEGNNRAKAWAAILGLLGIALIFATSFKELGFAHFEPAKSDYDLTFQKMVWEVDPTKSFISGSVTSEFTSKVNLMTELVLDLKDNMVVDSAIDSRGSLAFRHENDRLNIVLRQPLGPNERDNITVYYNGSPEGNGFGSFQTGTHDTGPILATLSEPYGAPTWWPCKMGLRDKIDSIEIRVQTDTAYKVGSNGKLSEVIANGSAHTYVWKHSFPIATYLVAIAVSNYDEYTDWAPGTEVDSFPILNYVYPQDLEDAKTKTPDLLPVMDIYNLKFEPYPFQHEKYGHAQWNWGGGMEHQSMSFMGHFGFSLMAHEVAHQWFGDKITLGSWQDIWLNEGFATYLNGLAYEAGLGGTPWIVWKRGLVTNITSQSGGSVWCNDTSSVSRIFDPRLSYNKAAMLLHMLRWKLGDDNFFNALKNYLNDPKLAFGFARTNDLKNHFENQSGQNLDEFFADWFFGEGHPVYQVNWKQGENGGVEVELSQEPSHPSVEFFEIPIELQFLNTNNGYDTIVVIDPSISPAEFSFSFPAVDDLIFDPNVWLISESTVQGKGADTGQRFSIRISPNPVNSYVSVDFKGSIYKVSEVMILDSRGRILIEFPDSNSPVPGFKIPVSGLTSGLYLLSMKLDGRSVIERFIGQ